jgi:hypothetical protein
MTEISFEYTFSLATCIGVCTGWLVKDVVVYVICTYAGLNSKATLYVQLCGGSVVIRQTKRDLSSCKS